MKRFGLLLFFFFGTIAAFGQDTLEQVWRANEATSALPYFGIQIDENNAISDAEMSDKYAKMKAVDTLQVKFVAKVKEVCQAKGCWMKLELEDGQETMVRFKDYGFFMPMDIKGKEVIVNGLAFVEEMSIEDQKHFAKDGGKSETEIATITNAKKTFSFEADGVLLKE